MSGSARGPFRPGTGATPPYLAGREVEQARLREFLADLASGRPPGTQIVLYGPRGNGKTVLLGWLKREAARVPGIRTAVLQPAEIPDPVRLRELLLPADWWGRMFGGAITVGGFSWKPGRRPPPPPKKVLADRARKGPLLLLLDEAHTLDLETGRVLLNAIQEVGAELPCLLVLAGTPNLRQHLNAMGASFWNRAAPIRVGRIGEEAAAEGFRRPFEEEGFSVAREALAAMVRESQCYPYFVQLLGSAVWRKAVEAGGRHRVTAKEVAAARAEFDLGKNDYYLHRLEELERLRLLTVAGSVADAFRGRTILTAPRFREAVAAGMGEGADLREVDGATDALRDLGYVWRVPGRMDWEPGIPSLMDYTRDQLR